MSVAVLLQYLLESFKVSTEVQEEKTYRIKCCILVGTIKPSTASTADEGAIWPFERGEYQL